MKAILVQLDERQHERVKAAARSAGMSMRRWTRLTLEDAANSAGGNGKDSLWAMVRQIRDVTCPKAIQGAGGDAVAALVQMGICEDEATRKVAAIVAGPRYASGTAEEIIRECLKDAAQG